MILTFNEWSFGRIVKRSLNIFDIVVYDNFQKYFSLEILQNNFFILVY